MVSHYWSSGELGVSADTGNVFAIACSHGDTEVTVLSSIGFVPARVGLAHDVLSSLVVPEEADIFHSEILYASRVSDAFNRETERCLLRKARGGMLEAHHVARAV